MSSSSLPPYPGSQPTDVHDRGASPLAIVGLATLALGPVILFILLQLARKGHNFTYALHIGAALFAFAGLVLVLLGLSRSQGHLLLAGVATLVTASLVGCSPYQTIAWVGSHEADLVVHVRDGDTGRPISGAAVRLFWPDAHESPGVQGHTDNEGEVRLHFPFFAYGTESAVADTGGMELFRYSLRVAAKGYTGLREPLQTYTGSGWPLYGPPLPEVVVGLDKDSKHIRGGK